MNAGSRQDVQRIARAAAAPGGHGTEQNSWLQPMGAYFDSAITRANPGVSYYWGSEADFDLEQFYINNPYALLRSPTVMACMDKISRAMQCTVLRLVDQFNRPVTGHPVARLLALPGPNQHQTWEAAFAAWTIDYYMTGAMMGEIQRRGSMGIPVGILPVPGETQFRGQIVNGQIEYDVNRRADGVPVARWMNDLANNVIIDQLRDDDAIKVVDTMTDGLVAVPRAIYSIGQAIQSEREGALWYQVSTRDRHAKVGFLTRNNPSGVKGRATGDRPDEEAANTLRSTIRKLFRIGRIGGGDQNTQKDTPPVVNSMDWKGTGYSAVEMQFEQIMSKQVDQVSRGFGVPSILINPGTSPTRGVFTEAESHMNRTTVRPIRKALAAAMSQKLLLPSELARGLKVDFQRELDADLSNVLITQVNGRLITPNEGRARLGLPPVPNGDSIAAESGSAAGAGGDDDQGDFQHVDFSRPSEQVPGAASQLHAARGRAA